MASKLRRVFVPGHGWMLARPLKKVVREARPLKKAGDLKRFTAQRAAALPPAAPPVQTRPRTAPIAPQRVPTPVARKPKVQKRKLERPDLVIYSRNPSNAARELSRKVGGRRLMGTQVAPPGAVVFNWGAGPGLNPQAAVSRAVNKLETLKCLTEAKVPTLRWTTTKEDVSKWLKKGHRVFARRSLTGSGGEGITIISNEGEFVQAPLYTRNYPKTHEFRVHVFDGVVIDFTEKKAKLDANRNTAVSDRLVRNHDNGWIYAHDNLSPSRAGVDAIKSGAVASVRALGLLYGAVDILAILDESTPRNLKGFAVCEINTAPGLECTQTINAYSNAIIRKYNSLKGR